MDPEGKVENADFETAILHTGYGRFQSMLLLVSGIVYATCAISATTLSFVLPSAECDFLLSSTDKGRLSAMPLIGMVFGSYVWGSLADTRGRKWIMIISLLVDALAAFISSFAQDYQWFLICRFFNGFGIIGATSLIFSYLGEFLSIINRDEMLCKLEVFWNIGIIVLPGIAWLILPQTWTFTNGQFTYNSWRIFVAICGLPSLFSAILLCFLPESPKYLIAKGQQDKARKILQGMYAVNTGNCLNEYPVQQLEGEAICLLNGSCKKHYVPWHIRLVTQAKDIAFLNKEVFAPPNTRYIFLTCFADFGLMSSYYTLLMWFPELFDRFDMYNALYPNKSAGVCDVASISSPVQVDDWKIKMIQHCPKPIDDKVFLYTIIIGASCLPSSISLSYLIRKVGKKRLIIFSLVTAGLAVIGLNWVQGTVDTLILSCIFEALTSTCEAVIFCVVVDLFPTSLRAMALALTVTSGRFGAILGNIAFGWLVDLNCFVPIYSFGFLLITSGLLCIYLPQGNHHIVLH